MLHLNISLTSLAAILCSGMMIIAGSIWVLSSQVRRLSEILERQGAKAGAPRTEAWTPRIADGEPILSLPRRSHLRVVERPSARAN